MKTATERAKSVTDCLKTSSRHVGSDDIEAAILMVLEEHELDIRRELEELVAELRAENKSLIDKHLDTGPMLPKKGITIRYTDGE